MNKEADYIANHVMDRQADMRYWNAGFLSQDHKQLTNIQGWSDGGSRSAEGLSSYGWILKGWTATAGPIILAVGGVLLNRAATSSLEVEALGLRVAVRDLIFILEARGKDKSNLSFNVDGRLNVPCKRQWTFDPIVQFLHRS